MKYVGFEFLDYLYHGGFHRAFALLYNNWRAEDYNIVYNRLIVQRHVHTQTFVLV